jgi:hypothetical protein
MGNTQREFDRDAFGVAATEVKTRADHRKIPLLQPSLGYEHPIPAADGKSKAGYIKKLQDEFVKTMRASDTTLTSIAAKCNGNLQKGPAKGQERLFEKARISYKGNLARVTDFERRSIVCLEFPHLLKALQELDSEFVVIRVKNRFSSPHSGAKKTAGYRDCQLTCKAKGSDLMFEVQLHLQCIYDVKEQVSNSENAAGRTGHDRYIEFRLIMEVAEAVRRAEAEETNAGSEGSGYQSSGPCPPSGADYRV